MSKIGDVLRTLAGQADIAQPRINAKATQVAATVKDTKDKVVSKGLNFSSKVLHKLTDIIDGSLVIDDPE